MIDKRRLWVAPSAQITERGYHRMNIAYRGKPCSVVVFRHEGQCRSFVNVCVHMPRELDCAIDTIFEAATQRLRCSMHGIVYDPVTGESLSTMCHGERLTAVQTEEDSDGVWLIDKHARAL